ACGGRSTRDGRSFSPALLHSGHPHPENPLRSFLVLGGLVLLGCGGGHGSLPIALSATPAASPPQAMACAKAQVVDPLKYELSSFDQTDLRLTARKNDYNAHRADPKFRRNVDRLEVEAVPGADGNTKLSVIGRTYAEYSTERGPTEVEESASTDVR